MRQEWCKGCSLCIDICPKGVFLNTEEISKRGFKVIKPIKEEKCIGCLLCELFCPDLVITVEEIKEDLSPKNSRGYAGKD